jgi:hypothetical protein
MSIELPHTTFTQADIQATQPALKVGLLATVTLEGLPHLTMISSMTAAAEKTVTWGQFVEGTCKENVRTNPHTSFLIMTLDKQLWRGKALWTHTERSGPEYERYNNIPMFRYNAYFGVHTVHYMDLLAQTGKQPLPMGAIIPAAIKSILARTFSPARGGALALNLWTRTLFNKLDNLKFLAYLDADGFPMIVPIIQAQSSGSAEVLFSTGAYGAELKAIPAGSPVAVLGLALSMEDVLLRGTYQGVRRRGGFSCGALVVEWVYNPMPPVPGQIYPPLELKPVIF